ncbi:MAG TPA: protein kinase [Kofleriaceae bacterium]|jgi:tetratricopeptide (TPR) repeat protein/predicted Ser/Thr protein kinase
MACPGDDVLVAMIEKALDPTQLSVLEVHLDSCESCREVVAFAVGSRPLGTGTTQLAAGTPDAGGASPDPDGLIGSTIAARYRVASVLGRGGMGTVYLARDITLDRDVAVKVHRSGSGKERLLREAVVMAQLAHPNVVNVFEVGSVDNWVFVAMEYVRGSTLRGWLEETSRDWTAVIAMLLEIGAGLTAAHAAGLVHRDFKPENVLVGTDGRPRVSDFGLARVDREQSTMTTSAGGSVSLDSVITVEGAVLGTPAYMAPEQLEGAAVDARADQFAFATVAFEALYKRRPFPGSTLGAVQQAIADQAIVRVSSTVVPTRVRDVVVRGLAASPSDRYPDMNAFLAALRRAAAPRTTRRVAIAAGVAALALVGAFPVRSAVAERRYIAGCSKAAGQVGGVFGETAQAIMFARFIGTSPLGHEKFDRSARVLERQAAALATATESACRERVAPVRRQCLSARTQEFSDLVNALQHADRGLVQRAPDVAWAGLDPTPCDDVTLPEAQWHASSDQISRLHMLRTLHDTGKYPEGIALGTPLLAEAQAANDQGFELAVLLALGTLRKETDQPAQVIPLYEQAEKIAEALGRDLDGVAALGSLVSLATDSRDFVGAHRSLELARAKLARVGGTNVLTEAKLELMEAELLAGEYKYAESEARQRDGIKRLEEVLGADHPQVGGAYGTLSQLLLAENKPTDSVVAARHALEILEAAYGPNHPTTAGARMTIGVTLVDLGQLDEARTLLLDADKVFVRAFGKGHPVRTGILGRIARIERTQGHNEKALAAFRETLELVNGSDGPESLLAAGVKMDIAVTLAALNRFPEAEQEAREGLKITEAVTPPDPPRISSALTDVATIQQAAGHDAAAIPTAERALGVFAKQADDVVNKSELSACRFVLAQALWNTKGDKARARSLAEQARVEGDVVAIERWLGSHKL